ncbi:7-methylguanosine phosphate-specific 5'-nucleotidase-like [Photinus pyralis]|uniref:7-methylguanosine phosphate-specific 5'-nucleotidase-like n=1 Tax=Photinus pyralis TaxID=7054 RepID=UPI0012670B09|nr:7-methylguanosine phosphate-specific 5'-nucleotidase-like [Photinus pyralis]
MYIRNLTIIGTFKSCRQLITNFHSMPSNFIKEISVLDRSKVHIKRKDNVNHIIHNLIKEGHKDLQIISDFDQTITRQYRQRQNVKKKDISSFGVFVRCPSISSTYSARARALVEKYQPIEKDPKVPVDEKRPIMEEWYTQIGQAIRGEKISRLEIEKTARESGPLLRNGVPELFCELNKAEIPLLIFSAGLGDAVEAILTNFNVLFPNIKIVSNFLSYNNDGVIEGFINDPIIHVFNKNESAIKDTCYYDVVEHCKNVILMGDSLGDCEMADGVPNLKNILKIGFVHDSVAENLPQFMDKFDIVLEDDQTMDVVRAILQFILKL